MPPRVIGFTGKAQSGKDTAADIMLERLPDYVKTSFAEPLKKMAQTGLGLTDDQVHGVAKDQIDHRYGCTPRHILQTLGTDWGRELVHPDLWTILIAERADNHGLIIPDVRFENEAEFVRSRGVLIHVTGRGGLADGGDHISELGVQRRDFDWILVNDGGIQDYRNTVSWLMREWVT